MLLNLTRRVLVMLLAVWLGGCTTIADQPMRMAGKPEETARPIKNYAELMKGFDRTLTETERKAVIAGLRREKQRQARLHSESE
jgi:hypothetical protein